MATETLYGHIEVTPGVAGGKPRVAGRRITVQNIAVWHERMGKSADEITAEYDLSLAEVYAALAYYFDHRDEIDRSKRQGEEFVEACKLDRRPQRQVRRRYRRRTCRVDIKVQPARGDRQGRARKTAVS